jgi:hypothetical protein
MIVHGQDVRVAKTDCALYLLLEGPLNLRVASRRKSLERVLFARFILHQVDNAEASAADFSDYGINLAAGSGDLGPNHRTKIPDVVKRGN